MDGKNKHDGREINKHDGRGLQHDGWEKTCVTGGKLASTTVVKSHQIKKVDTKYILLIQMSLSLL